MYTTKLTKNEQGIHRRQFTWDDSVTVNHTAWREGRVSHIHCAGVVCCLQSV